MALININQTDDEFYRYKMPSLTTKHECGKTVIENMIEISKALNRPPKCLFFYYYFKNFRLFKIFFNRTWRTNWSKK